MELARIKTFGNRYNGWAANKNKFVATYYSKCYKKRKMFFRKNVFKKNATPFLISDVSQATTTSASPIWLRGTFKQTAKLGRLSRFF